MSLKDGNDVFNEAMDMNRPKPEREAPRRKTQRDRKAPPEPPLEAEQLQPHCYDQRPFTELGFQRKRFYILAAAKLQVTEWTAGELHRVGELLNLAPEAWWVRNYPPRAGSNQPWDVTRAADEIIRKCHACGVYDARRVRGRGVWMDEGRVVVHLGDELLVDSRPVALNELVSDWQYERAARIRVDPTVRPATVKEASRLVHLCTHLPFVHPDRDAPLLAGWIACSMIAGALRWRPHAWLHSEAGEGKTWIMNHVVKLALGDLCVMAAAKSTEPGIRRRMGQDSLGFMYDEAEGDTPNTRNRVSDILELLRQSASESDAELMQAVSGGSLDVMSFRPNFPGLLGSVHLGLTKSSDKSRFMIMPIKASTREAFTTLQEAKAECFIDGFTDKLFSRVLRLLPTIQRNIDLLRDTIADTGGMRTGDVLGTTLAGYLALISDDTLTKDTALAFVARHPWLVEAVKERETVPEWRKLLGFIGQQRMRLPGGQEIAVSEAASLLARHIGVNGVALEELERTFGQHGFRIVTPMSASHTGPGVYVHNTSATMDKWLSGQPWQGSWKATLARCPGSQAGGSRYFPGLSSTSRCVGIPLGVFTGHNSAEPHGADDA